MHYKKAGKPDNAAACAGLFASIGKCLHRCEACMDVGHEGNCTAAAMQAHLIGLPCVVQDALCAGGLASINVCADTNISVPLQGHNAAACAAMQQSLCLLLWKSLSLTVWTHDTCYSHPYRQALKAAGGQAAWSRLQACK